jgi:predicted dehydrogenase
MIMRARRRIRYAVAGLGHIAQAAVLPAFAHARGTSELAALVSSSPEKLERLGRRYGVDARFGYDRFEEGMRDAGIDAVYVALPNDLHREFTERAASAGVHVLCEKPMAVTEDDALAMIRATEAARVRLMIAYRLHFEEANLGAIEIARSGKIGDPRLFSSTFTLNVRPGNIRVRRARGGGAGWDIGIYCVNAARYLFGDEPIEVCGMADAGSDERFREVEENLSAVLRFPGGRIAGFACGFGASDVSEYRLTGERGDVRLDPAYEYAGPRLRVLTVDGKARERSFPARDQFAPLLDHFSRCLLEDREPEPGGLEGLADVRILEAIYRSSRTGTALPVTPVTGLRRPDPAARARKPPVRRARTVGVEPSSM